MPGAGPPVWAYFDCLDQSIRLESKALLQSLERKHLTNAHQAAGPADDLFFQVDFGSRHGNWPPQRKGQVPQKEPKDGV